MNDHASDDQPDSEVLGKVATILDSVDAEDAFRQLDNTTTDKSGAGSNSDDTTGGKAGDKDKGPSQATRLVELANAGYRTVAGDDGKTYAVALDGARIALPLRGENGLRLRLASAYYAET